MTSSYHNTIELDEDRPDPPSSHRNEETVMHSPDEDPSQPGLPQRPRRGRPPKNGNGQRTTGPHRCNYCHKGFNRNSDLSRHVNIHTGNRPHPCPVCNKSFIQTSALTVHMRVHTGEKPHVCPRCNRCFADSSSLSRHRRIHNDICSCPQCDFKTNTPKKLTTHLKKVHAGPAQSVSSDSLSTSVEPPYASQLPPGQLPLPPSEDSRDQLFPYPRGSEDHEQPLDSQMLPYAQTTFTAQAIPQSDQAYSTYLPNEAAGLSGSASAPYMWAPATDSVPLSSNYIQGSSNEFPIQQQNMNQISAPLMNPLANQSSFAPQSNWHGSSSIDWGSRQMVPHQSNGIFMGDNFNQPQQSYMGNSHQLARQSYDSQMTEDTVSSEAPLPTPFAVSAYEHRASNASSTWGPQSLIYNQAGTEAAEGSDFDDDENPPGLEEDAQSDDEDDSDPAPPHDDSDESKEWEFSGLLPPAVAMYQTI